MEVRLSSQARLDLDEAMADAIAHLRQTYTYTSKFDAFFNQLLTSAEYDLNKMFLTTYGLLYQQNSHVFTDLFKDLRKYYREGGIDLTDALDNFFATLLQKMFQLLNAHYYMDELYLSCVSDTMDELKPFGDVPERLSLQLRRSFVAARTFVQGLSVGRDFVHKISQLPLTSECHDAVLKTVYCSYCQGIPFLKPCNKLCLDVMKLCLAQHSQIDAAWDKYIDHILLLGDRLEGPFNIEQVVDPIEVKISDAIMNFQENDAEVSKRVFKACGQPQYHDRKRRDVGGIKNVRGVVTKAGNVTAAAATTMTTTTTTSRVDLDQVADKDAIVFIDDEDVASSRVDADVDPTAKSGKPVDAKSRPKRKKISADGKTEMPYQHPKRNGRKPLLSKPGGASLSLLVREIKDKVKVGRGFWSHLPYALCNDEKLSAPADIEDNCWNGVGRGRYESDAGGGGGDGKNVELQRRLAQAFTKQKGSRHSIVADQLVALSGISKKLRMAYEGLNVNWMDNALADAPSYAARYVYAGGSGDGVGVDDEDYEGSGGSGSGDDTYVDASSGGGDITFTAESGTTPVISPVLEGSGKPKTGRSCQEEGCGSRGQAGAVPSFHGELMLFLIVALILT